MVTCAYRQECVFTGVSSGGCSDCLTMIDPVDCVNDWLRTTGNTK